MSASLDVSIWMPMYTRDWLAATAHLDAVQIGILYRLMLHWWANGGHLPESDANRARIAGVDRRTYQAHRDIFATKMFFRI